MFFLLSIENEKLRNDKNLEIENSTIIANLKALRKGTEIADLVSIKLTQTVSADGALMTVKSGN